MLLEHEADRPSVQHHPRDPASVNAMKQTCVIVILAYFTLLSIFLHWISLKQIGVGCVLSDAITSSQRHNCRQCFREQKHRKK